MSVLESHIQRPLRILLVAVALVGLAGGYCLGRAGGGGGGHASSGSHSYSSSHSSYSGQGDIGTVLVLLLVVTAVLVYVAVQNAQLKAELSDKLTAVHRLTAELEQRDPLWNLQAMTSRVNEVFFKVQAAWVARDQNLARDCMSDQLYRRHKAQTDQMLAEKTRNVLENIQLAEVLIYSVADYHDDARDTFAAQLTGSMIDYTVKEAHGYVTVGDRVNRRHSLKSGISCAKRTSGCSTPSRPRPPPKLSVMAAATRKVRSTMGKRRVWPKAYKI